MNTPHIFRPLAPAVFALLASCGGLAGVARGAPAAQIEFGGPADDTERARVELYDVLRSEPRETPESRVAQAAGPSVVYVETEMLQAVRTWVGTENRLRHGAGSGVVIHPSGLIVTNYHVVQGAQQIRVSFEGDAEPYDAELMSFVREEDLALLKIVQPEASQSSGTRLGGGALSAGPTSLRPEIRAAFPTVRMGTSSDLMPGERVVAIGSPHGQAYTVSTGIISGLHRQVAVPTRNLNFRGLIQTDASINFGNSGGPLLNIHGELIGINTVMNASAENIGFAIPIDRVRQIVEDVLLPNARKVWLGLDYDEQPDGLVVTHVWAGGPASASGICEGDRLLGLGDEAAEGLEAFNLLLLQVDHGQLAALDVARGDETFRADVRAWDALNGEFFIEIGMTVSEFRPARGGDPVLRVESVRPESPAAALGAQPGDLIPAVKPLLGRRPQTIWLSDKATLKLLLDRIPAGTEIEVDAYRDLNGDNIIKRPEQLKGVLVR